MLGGDNRKQTDQKSAKELLKAIRPFNQPLPSYAKLLTRLDLFFVGWFFIPLNIIITTPLFLASFIVFQIIKFLRVNHPRLEGGGLRGLSIANRLS
jgi:hypothetical protein